MNSPANRPQRGQCSSPVSLGRVDDNQIQGRPNGADRQDMDAPQRLPWFNQGKDPDYRFTLANERTYLAWIRTALAVLAGSILLRHFVTELRPLWLGPAIAAALSVVAATIAGAAYTRWRSNELAMRLGLPLPHSSLLSMLAAMIGTLAVIAAYAVFRL